MHSPIYLRSQKKTTTDFWATVASLTETFVFLYLGLAIFSFGHEYNTSLIFISLVSIFIARAANIFPIAWLVNYFRVKNKIPKNQQIMLWFAGLRGAIAMALSLDVPIDATRPVIFTTTLVIVLFTVLLMGGSTPTILAKLQIPMGGHGGEAPGGEDPAEVAARPEDKFSSFDRLYLKPFFTRVRHEAVHGHEAFNHHKDADVEVQLVPSHKGSENTELVTQPDVENDGND